LGVHPFETAAKDKSLRPGWEYYPDMLVAARAGKALPSFEDYYPALKPHYLAEEES